MGSTQQFCLKWNNHQSNMLAVFDRLLSNRSLVDVTLGCEGISLKAHKVVLSACSPFFESLFADNPCKHPIVILKDIRYMDLKALVEFMYRGEVNVSQEQLPALLKTAEALKIKGLAEVTGDAKSSVANATGASTAVPQNTTSHVPPSSTASSGCVPPVLGDRPDSPRRKRQRLRHNSGDGKSDSEADTNSGSRQNGTVSQQSQSRVPVDAPDVLEDGSMDEDSGDEKDADSGPPGVNNGNHDVDEEEGDFEPSKLLEQSMTENFGAGAGHDSSSAGGDSSSNAGEPAGGTPRDSLIVPSDSSLDIKPIINFDDASGDSAQAVAAAAAVAAAQAVAGANPLMFVNNNPAAALAGAGPSTNAAGAVVAQQSHGMYAPTELSHASRRNMDERYNVNLSPVLVS